MVKTPNIRPAEPPHSDCRQNMWPEPGGHWNLLGDVRRCRHGKVQVLTETTSRYWAGPGTHWWRDLHPFWDFRTYRTAEAALDADKDF